MGLRQWEWRRPVERVSPWTGSTSLDIARHARDERESLVGWNVEVPGTWFTGATRQCKALKQDRRVAADPLFFLTPLALSKFEFFLYSHPVTGRALDWGEERQVLGPDGLFADSTHFNYPDQDPLRRSERST
jgi:hypothetical protein